MVGIGFGCVSVYVMILLVDVLVIRLMSVVMGWFVCVLILVSMSVGISFWMLLLLIVSVFIFVRLFGLGLCCFDVVVHVGSDELS